METDEGSFTSNEITSLRLGDKRRPDDSQTQVTHSYFTHTGGEALDVLAITNPASSKDTITLRVDLATHDVFVTQDAGGKFVIVEAQPKGVVVSLAGMKTRVGLALLKEGRAEIATSELSGAMSCGH